MPSYGLCKLLALSLNLNKDITKILNPKPKTLNPLRTCQDSEEIISYKGPPYIRGFKVEGVRV